MINVKVLKKLFKGQILYIVINIFIMKKLTQIQQLKH